MGSTKKGIARGNHGAPVEHAGASFNAGRTKKQQSRSKEDEPLLGMLPPLHGHRASHPGQSLDKTAKMTAHSDEHMPSVSGYPGPTKKGMMPVPAPEAHASMSKGRTKKMQSRMGSDKPLVSDYKGSHHSY